MCVFGDSGNDVEMLKYCKYMKAVSRGEERRMNVVHNIEFRSGSKEEKLPGFSNDFPYIASRAELNRYMGGLVPWHWHKAIELFYMESGGLEYYTPKGKAVFRAGSGGMVNSNVLHMTKSGVKRDNNVQLLHIFDSSVIAGEQGSLIGRKYVMPIVAAPQLEIIALYPDDPGQAKVLELIEKSFRIPRQDFGYEIRLREALSEIWLSLFELSRQAMDEREEYDKRDDKIKLMMIYIHEHYADKIEVRELAAAAFLSERECFRVFRDCLHMTPTEYMRSYRLQMACQMLAKGDEPITGIGRACGLGSSSYFGKVFREYMGCTPLQYRCRSAGDVL